MNAYKMKKSQINTLKAAVLAALLLPMASFAELKSMTDEELAATQAQAGANDGGINIGIDMVINKFGNKNTNPHNCPANRSHCQFGIKLDNMNNPAWLTFTGVSGGVNIRKMNVQSSAVYEYEKDENGKYKKDENGDKIKVDGSERPAIRIGFYESQKITFTDFGFSSLRVAKDKVDSTGKVTEGYRTVGDFGDVNTVDAGRQLGLLGMRINGDVAVSGGIKIFNCTTC